VKNINNEERKFKARLLVDGSQHENGVDVGDNYSLTLNKDSLRIIIPISAQFGNVVHQMDVVTACLHKNIDMQGTMELPQLAFDEKT
jgi:Reverse transcriptase (RNA-dependent DNA polymerase)